MNLHRHLIVFALFLCGGMPAFAQPEEDKDAVFLRVLIKKSEEEYRKFGKRPEKLYEFWAAMKYERQLGQFELVGIFLKDLLALDDPNDEEKHKAFEKELVKIELAEGMDEVLKIQAIQKWSDNDKFNKLFLENASTFVTKVYDAVDRDLSDPAKFKKFIPRLSADTIEERAFAFIQLKRSKERAAAYLVEALRTNVDKPLYKQIVEALVRLDPEIIPPLLEILRATDEDPGAGDLPPTEKVQKDRIARFKDAADTDLRLSLLDILIRRGDRRSLPYLYHLSSAPLYPQLVRMRAKELLAKFLETNPDFLPPAKVQLTELAEKYYRHKINFPDAKGVPFWKWDGQKLALKPEYKTPAAAEEFFGLRYAKDALELDPGYVPAQVLYLSLMLERRIGPNLEKFILQPLPPDLQRLLASMDAELLLKIMDRGLDEGNIPIILATVQTLGERGEVRALRQSSATRPSGLIRALYDPDRRVQFVAVKAMLGMPGTPVPAGTGRVVEVLRNLLTLESPSKALMLGFPADKIARFRTGLEATGLKPISARSIREAFEIMQGSSNFEAIFLHEAITEIELPYILSQLRADSDTGRQPIFIFVDKEKVPQWDKLTSRYRNVKILPDFWIGMEEELKTAVAEALVKAGIRALTPNERKAITSGALDIVWRMARQEIVGYDIRPTVDNVIRLLAHPDYGVEALETISRIPGFPIQQRLTSMVLDDKGGKLRVAAAKELNRHVQKFGLLLNRDQLTELKVASLNPEAEPGLKRELAILLGSQNITATQSGSRLFQFRPETLPPIPPPPEKKDDNN